MRATFVTDGTSDRCLLPLIEWVLNQHAVPESQVDWADLRGRQTGASLTGRVEAALALYPCDLLFVHRDSEGQPPSWRYEEINAATPDGQLCVPVVPVRMQEAWLLHDELSIRLAAGRPSGAEPLDLPRISRIESVASPKDVLEKALVLASGTKGRRRKRFDTAKTAYRLSMLIRDWSPLRALPAFQRFEADTRDALNSLSIPLRDFKE
jgi:hypothetical protein